MRDWFFDSPDPEQTFEYAADLGRSIGAGGLKLALVGPLGAGKTVFVKGLAEGLGLDARAVSSPTFVIAQQYPIPTGPETLHHVDLYRMGSPAEAWDLGLDEQLFGEGVCVIEWADRAAEIFPEDCLWIDLDYQQDNDKRIIKVEPGMAPEDSRFRGLLEKLAKKTSIANE